MTSKQHDGGRLALSETAGYPCFELIDGSLYVFHRYVVTEV